MRAFTQSKGLRMIGTEIYKPKTRL